MNERKLLDNWKNFAANNGFEFDQEEKPNFQGIITKLTISLNSETKLIAHIGKTNAGINQNWTKVILSNQEKVFENQTFKKKTFTFFKSKGTLKNSMNKFLKSLGAIELKIYESQITLKFDYILYSEDQLTATLSIQEKINQQLAKNKVY